ncbi:MAG: queuosine precursor transporter [Gammaproteobacteria bacterium]|nr:queuosine precursor transporter [Gammaproteobacteria bacterium]
MIYVNKTRKPSSYLIVIFTTICLTSLVLTNKIIEWHGIVISSCLWTFPLLFLIGDVVSEVYGPKEAQKLLIYTFLSCFLFSIITNGAIKVPSATFYNNTNAYQQVLGQDLRFTFIALVGILVGSWVNIYAISKWKILLKGKYFCLRSVGATAVGELVNSIIVFPLSFSQTLSAHEILNIIIASYAIKMLYALISVYPAFLFVIYLKMKEGLDETFDKLSQDATTANRLISNSE